MRATSEESEVWLDGPAGRLQARLARGSVPGARAGLVICHPHLLYGGSMTNNVVLALRRAGGRLGLATLRFNFRGTGASAGRHDSGRGEVDDARAAVAHLAREAGLEPEQIALAGYSFGAGVAAAAIHDDAPALVLVSPPPETLEGTSGLRRVNAAVLAIAGDRDPYCPPNRLEPSIRDLAPGAEIEILHGVDHGWWDYEAELETRVVRFLAGALGSPRGDEGDWPEAVRGPVAGTSGPA